MVPTNLARVTVPPKSGIVAAVLEVVLLNGEEKDAAKRNNGMLEKAALNAS
jgi:hypothetical protein